MYTDDCTRKCVKCGEYFQVLPSLRNRKPICESCLLSDLRISAEGKMFMENLVLNGLGLLQKELMKLVD